MTGRKKHDAGASRVAERLFQGSGEMAALMRSTDWGKTQLGPVEEWPSSLRTMLGVVLGSRFPMLLWWGPDLLHLYNDAYRPMLRDKHPASLGAPAAEVWAEVWDVAGPMARGVQEGGPATWTEDLQLFIKSADMAEETYFTFSYSPVPDDDGGVGGLLNTVQETTVKVQGERQIRMLHDLAARASEAKSTSDAYRVVAEVLGSNELDLPFTLLYRIDDAGEHVDLVAASGFGDYHGRAKLERSSLRESGPDGWPFDTVWSSGRELVVGDLSARFGPLPEGRWNARPERAVVLPLFRPGHVSPSSFLVAGMSPHRADDERYRRFFLATATQVANVLAQAGAYEAETKRAHALAELDRAKTTFFNNVSHEFRTPLTLILGPVEDALARPERSLDGVGLEAVHRSSLRLLRLVNSLLDFARIEAGRLEVTFVATDLPAFTAELASSFRSVIERGGLRLVVDCPPIAAPVYVDPAQWEKIVLNLVSNAFKFTFEGEIAVRVRAHGSRVALTVTDTGIGIPPEALPRLFERFYRVDDSHGRSFEGTGIGLSLVRELVELHGGSLEVSSAMNEGSTFTVWLPTGSAHLPAEHIAGRVSVAPAIAASYVLEASEWRASAETPSIEPASPPPPAPGSDTRRQPRVLVVDDNADMRSYLVRLLSSRFRVETAEHGAIALEMARADPPDLVLSDVMMPVLDGFALLRELREHPRTSHLPVVLLSARTGEESVLEGLDTGADDYLMKPFSARELIARVHTHVEMARLRRQWSSELERANSELEAFSYSVSHDLRAPLRAVDGFSDILLRDYSGSLDADGRNYLTRVRAGTQRMSQLIDDLLSLARIARTSLRRASVDLSEIARGILTEASERDRDRRVDWIVSDGLVVDADSHLLRAMLENLLGNAWKFTAKTPSPTIRVGREERSGELVFFVRDNGAGFDMAYAKRLFAPFQRLHSQKDFQGTGIGLATVQRIVSRHRGRIWAEAEKGSGATFFFTLGDRR